MRGWLERAGVRIALIVGASRLWAWAFMVAGSYFPKHNDPTYWAGQTGHLLWRQIPIRIWDVLGRWDTDFYVAIARDGYPPLSPDGGWIYNAAYFPLLPSLMRGVSTLLGGANLFLVGIAVANTMLVLAVVYLVKLVRLDHPMADAEAVIACLMAYPGSHFLSCVYPESTALFLGAFAVYCARRRLNVAAGLACGLAVVARASGFLIALPVLYELCLDDQGRFELSPRVLVLAFPGVTMGLHLLNNWALYRDPLYFVHVQAGWGRHPQLFTTTLLHSPLSLDFHLFAILAIAVVIWGVVWRERSSYLVLAGANALLPLSTGLLNGVQRYMASNFPLYFIAGRGLMPHPRWRRAYWIVGAAVLALYSFKWGQGYQPN